MTLRMVLATHNGHKVAELRRILGGLDVELLDASGVGLPEVEETGETFADNARIKARESAAHSRLPCLADDSGLTVEALGGEPGVRSARYAGEPKDDRRNVQLLLERTEDIDDRRAAFICVAALAMPDGRDWLTVGELHGTIASAPSGTGGFGYDPVFVPEGHTRTLAELDDEEKDAISHRGLAFRAMLPAIEALSGADSDPWPDSLSI